jgi:heat shock protein HtpX
MFDQIEGNVWRSYLLIFLFILLVLGVGWAIGDLSGYGYDLLPIALAAALLMSWGSYYYSDRIVLGISGARPASHEEFPFLYNTVEGLSIAAGLPMPRLYIIDDTAPNAFATGRDPQHAVICVTTGLMSKLERVEMEGVIGHEMSHIKNYDIRFMTLVAILVGVVALLADWGRRLLWFGGGRRGGRRSGGGGIIALVALVLLLLSPIVAMLMQLALSRRREFLADASGAMLTRYPEGLANALTKLDADTEPLEAANKATAHLYIVNPLKEHGGRLNGLFSTHPPIEERVRRLRAM